MGPNDIELVRVFTRVQGGPVSGVTFAVGAPFEVVLEAEAGANIMAAGNWSYQVGVVIRDLTDPAAPPIASQPPANPNGNIPNQWGPAGARSFVFTVAGQPANKADHCYEVLAFLRAAPMAAVPDVSFARSDLLMIY